MRLPVWLRNFPIGNKIWFLIYYEAVIDAILSPAV